MTVYTRFLANGHLAGSEKSRDSNHGLYGSRAWILDPDPAPPPSSESSSPKAYSGSPQLLQQLVWLLLKTAAWEADPPGPGPLRTVRTPWKQTSCPTPWSLPLVAGQPGLRLSLLLAAQMHEVLCLQG